MSKAGWIVKEGGRYKTWKKRWMVIENDALAYYKKENKKDRCGEIKLRQATDIQKVDYKGKKHCFQIVTPERTFHVCAESADEMNTWIAQIKNTQQSLKGAPAKAAGAAGAAPSAGGVTSPGAMSPAVGGAAAGGMTPGAPAGPSNTDAFADAGAGQGAQKVGVEDFDLLKVVGKGSFGKVMLVRKKDNGKVYAMKVLNKKTIVERNEVEHTKSERAILMKLNHPFLVRLHYSFQTPDKLYFIMDFVNGGELFFHLQKDRRFSEERVRFYAAEIAAGLEYLHSQGVIYRDLKPENLLLTADGNIIMTDFGLSKEGLLGSDDRTSTFCGTPEYLAPEILDGKGYGKAVDWWSFGTLIYEMMTGLPPFYCEDVQQMYNKIMTGSLPIPDTMSPEAADLITKLLERDPALRLQEPSQIRAHPFFASLNWDALLAKQVPPPFKPDVKDEIDINNIDAAFTDEPVNMSDDDEADAVEATEDGGFAGFTYVSGK